MSMVALQISWDTLVETLRNLSWDKQCTLLELLETWVDEKEANIELSDETKANLNQALQEAEAGETVAWETVKKKLTRDE